MLRALAVVVALGGATVVVAGCGFRGREVPDALAANDDAPAPGIDAADPDAVASTFCDPIDKLIACYEFEGDVRDLSGNHHDATTANALFVTGKAGKAMLFGLTSEATVAGSDQFDVDALTIEAWVRPDLLPVAGMQSVILDVDKQYAFSINDDGTLTCDLHGLGKFGTTAAIVAGAWSHVACTYDGATAARIYIDGNSAATRAGNSDLSGGGNPMAIAGNSPTGLQLVGLIDQLRLLGVARSGAQICSDAGKTACL